MPNNGVMISAGVVMVEIEQILEKAAAGLV